jgi:hypothetical protein
MRERLIKLRQSKYDLDQARSPEYLRLPDGRRVDTRSLLNRATKSSYINLRTKTATDSALEAYNQKRGKYTLAERQWIATAEPRQILQRYPRIEIGYLKSFIKQSQDIVRTAQQHLAAHQARHINI